MKKQLKRDLMHLLDDAIHEDNPVRALGKMEDAKKLFEKIHYEIWMDYHKRNIKKISILFYCIPYLYTFLSCYIIYLTVLLGYLFVESAVAQDRKTVS